MSMASIMMTNTPDDGTLAALIGRRSNVVLIDEDIPGVKVPRVFVENDRARYRATRHLIEAGHRRHRLSSAAPIGLFSAEERTAGFLRAMSEAGLAVRRRPRAPRQLRARFRPRGRRSTFARQQTPPTAIFASSDYLAIGAMLGLRQAGVSRARRDVAGRLRRHAADRAASTRR